MSLITKIKRIATVVALLFAKGSYKIGDINAYWLRIRDANTDNPRPQLGPKMRTHVYPQLTSYLLSSRA